MLPQFEVLLYTLTGNTFDPIRQDPVLAISGDRVTLVCTFSGVIVSHLCEDPQIRFLGNELEWHTPSENSPLEHGTNTSATVNQIDPNTILKTTSTDCTNEILNSNLSFVLTNKLENIVFQCALPLSFSDHSSITAIGISKLWSPGVYLKGECLCITII